MAHPPAANPSSRDHVRPFLFEALDIRGAIVQLDSTWHSMLAGRDYPPAAVRALGELAAVTSLIGANLKQPGRITFQLKGSGPIDLLVLHCDQELRLRGMARVAPERTGELDTAASPLELLGDGQLALTLDTPALRVPYQSLVPLTGASLAEAFQHYLERSEQQPAALLLAASAECAAGLFMQKLPGADARDADGWDRVRILAATVHAEELLHSPMVALLTKVFAEEDIRLFDPRPVRHHCPQDWDKIGAMLRGLGRAECESILREQGEIHIHDELCNHDYRIDAGRLEALLAAPATH